MTGDASSGLSLGDVVDPGVEWVDHRLASLTDFLSNNSLEGWYNGFQRRFLDDSTVLPLSRPRRDDRIADGDTPKPAATIKLLNFCSVYHWSQLQFWERTTHAAFNPTVSSLSFSALKVADDVVVERQFNAVSFKMA